MTIRVYLCRTCLEYIGMVNRGPSPLPPGTYEANVEIAVECAGCTRKATRKPETHPDTQSK